MRKKLAVFMFFAVISVSAISSLFMIAPSSDVENPNTSSWVNDNSNWTISGITNSSYLINRTELRIPDDAENIQTKITSIEFWNETEIRRIGNASSTHIEDSWDIRDSNYLEISGFIPYYFPSGDIEWNISVEFQVNGLNEDLLFREVNESGDFPFEFSYSGMISYFGLVFHTNQSGFPPVHPVFNMTDGGKPAVNMDIINFIPTDDQVSGGIVYEFIDNGNCIELNSTEFVYFNATLETSWRYDEDTSGPIIEGIKYPQKVTDAEEIHISANITDPSGVNATLYYGYEAPYNYSVNGNNTSGDKWEFLISAQSSHGGENLTFYIISWDGDTPSSKSQSDYYNITIEEKQNKNPHPQPNNELFNPWIILGPVICGIGVVIALIIIRILKSIPDMRIN